MTTRAIQVIRDGDIVIMPGEFIVGKPQIVLDQWVEDGFAVRLPDAEDNPKPNKRDRETKEVKRG